MSLLWSEYSLHASLIYRNGGEGPAWSHSRLWTLLLLLLLLPLLWPLLSTLFFNTVGTDHPQFHQPGVLYFLYDPKWSSPLQLTVVQMLSSEWGHPPSDFMYVCMYICMYVFPHQILNCCDSWVAIAVITFFSSVQFGRSVVSDSLRPHESQHTRPPCPSPTPGVYSTSCPLSRWCHPAISSSVVPFSSCPQCFPASGSFPMSQLLAWGGQSIGVSASASVLPMNTQDLSPSGWTGWISLQSKGLSRVFSNTTVQKHQFSSAQLSSQSNSHIHTWPWEKP